MNPAPTGTRPRPRRRFLPDPGPLSTLLVFALGAAVLWGAYRALDPTPDKHIVAATGTAQGAYAEYGKRYVALLKANGVTLTLRPTQGTKDNLALLRDPTSGVQVALVQGGVEPPPADPDNPDTELVSLGSVAYEPLWLFYREDSARRLLKGRPLTELSQMAGWRINTGPPGGGTGPLVAQLAPVVGLPASSLHSGDGATVNGIVDLVQGREDALALVSAADAPFVQYLLHTPGIRLFDFTEAEALARRFPFLHPLKLPRGLIDPAKVQPPQDMQLVAATASLVARRDLHPALIQLLVQAAQRVHGQPGWFSSEGEFPNVQAPIFPLAPEAERIYRSGPPLLQRYLPFWLANFFDRMWIVILPLIAALLPLSRVLPPLVVLRLRSRIFRWYRQLRALEDARGLRPTAELLSDLDAIDARVAEVEVPLSYAEELYTLRSHIAMVRGRLAA
ncbi:MAG: C4-dicarboxylate ABC transporter substrate-binding protein [Burkholderiales bacterium]|nr:C4-dicarboxylate ABC transporter substrate-binding protein [Burkholderiales bacterium]MDE2398386.1 C4-dicarboxylate ABC transporter substrate-binding protein [Burkholderiales bacterium]MDE2452413.1 C4-dicarboxylate ABC transporter substrate-binding protein [Burkholderiales bacterium]